MRKAFPAITLAELLLNSEHIFYKLNFNFEKKIA